MSCTGTTAVVTGASSGIGWALAVELARQGARVGAIARRGDKLTELATQVRAAGGVIATAVADVADRTALQVAIGSVEAELGPTDLLIANAGMSHHTGAEQMYVEKVEEILRVNFLGVVYAIEAVMAGMLQRGGGHIVGISSLAAFKGLPGAAAYCASKSAVNAYLESLRIELRSKRIAVTAVCPGFVNTPIIARNPTTMFLMQPDAAARRIVKSLRRRRGLYCFPKRMAALMWLTKWAPDWLIARKVLLKKE